MQAIRVLLVDDDDVLRDTLMCVLEESGFRVTAVPNVPEALKRISSSETYDVLVSDLHMPGAGDGLTVISAMRHANPLAVTMLLSANPQMGAAIQAILQQTDEILLKPLDVTRIAEAIRRRILQGVPNPPKQRTETVADVLERATESIMQDCFARIQAAEKKSSGPISEPNSISGELRCGYLALVLQNIISRLLPTRSPVCKDRSFAGAMKYGKDRRLHSDGPSMLVEEFRLLQASIFHALQKNLPGPDQTSAVADVMTIADEIQGQLDQVLAAYSTDFQSSTAKPFDGAALRGDRYQTV
jgi:CheY-like chemotaxis protein